MDSSRYHLRHADQQPSAAYRASLATRWPVQPQCPCSQPEYLERGGQSLGLAFPSGLPLQAGSAASLLLVLMSYAARPSAEEMGLLTRATDKLYARLLLKDSNTCQSALVLCLVSFWRPVGLPYMCNTWPGLSPLWVRRLVNQGLLHGPWERPGSKEPLLQPACLTGPLEYPPIFGQKSRSFLSRSGIEQLRRAVWSCAETPALCQMWWSPWTYARAIGGWRDGPGPEPSSQHLPITSSG